jgi:vacuolar-type H+-ATPase subunit I/STV1
MALGPNDYTRVVSSVVRDTHPQHRVDRGWGGWIVFAGLMTVLLGLYHAAAGFTALFRDDVYLTTPEGAAVSTNFTAWGWLQIVLGVVLVVAGVRLFSSRKLWSRIVVVLVALAQILVEFVYLTVTPLWSGVAIVVGIVCVYAVVVHGRDEVALLQE